MKTKLGQTQGTSSVQRCSFGRPPELMKIVLSKKIALCKPPMKTFFDPAKIVLASNALGGSRPRHGGGSRGRISRLIVPLPSARVRRTPRSVSRPHPVDPFARTVERNTRRRAHATRSVIVVAA
jgi:hypothetical protein